MGMAAYNGKMYAGTLPLAEVYRYDGGTTWTKVSQATAGTIASGGTASIIGIYSMANVDDTLYVGVGQRTTLEGAAFLRDHFAPRFDVVTVPLKLPWAGNTLTV